MKIYWRILAFARPLGAYAVPYFFYTLIYALFNSILYIMIIPMMSVLFNVGDMQAVTQAPTPKLSMDYLNELLNYAVFKVFGENADQLQMLMLIAGLLILVALISNLFRFLGQRTVENLRIRTLEKLRNQVYDNVMGLDVGYFTNERKGDIMAKITNDVQVVQFCITNTLQVAFRDPMLIIGYVVMLFTISWKLTVFSILYLPVVALLIGMILKKLRQSAAAAQQSYADMVSTLDESLGGIKIIKSYNAVDYIRGKFHDINTFYSNILYWMAGRQQMASPASEFLGITAAAVLLVVGGSMVFSGNGGLDGAAFIAYIAMFTQIPRPIRSFADAFSSINQGVAAGERVMELLDSTPKVQDGTMEMEEFRGSIEFRDVRFAYEKRTVIDGVSFTVRKGETVALVGSSGGGKSTLADLLPRFYDVQGGAIYIDGVNIRDYRIESMREHIGMVAQDTVLFNDTIENNILMGRRTATHDEIVEAARVANADAFIREAPNGYDTNIGDRGSKLSGGQRQRLSIARAVLKNPSILVLDEATSALDTESEKLVQQALDTLLKGRTSLVIAHRLSTIRGADRILVVDAGRIAEQGTHDQLMAANGIYRRLVEMQQVK